MFEPDRRGKKFGVFWFAPDISLLNATTLLYGSFSSIALLTFMNFVQPYLLTEVLQIPEERQGSLTGNLAALQELVVIAVIGIAGALSDRTGRRILFVTGFVILAFGYFIYPLAQTELQLVIFRILFAVGAAIVPVMLSACLVDYIQEVSRGKWVGLSSIFNGLGVLFMAAVLSQTPNWYLDMGADSIGAGRYAFWTAAALCLVAAGILFLGLKRGVATDAPPKENVFAQLGRGVSAARNNPRLALSYAGAFIGRGDLVIVGTFFSLWIVQAGTDIGMSTGEAQGRAGMMFGIIQLSALTWAFFMGMIADKLNRVTAFIIALVLASAGYGLMGQVDDPFGSSIIPICILLGMGETSIIITGGALMGQEAPRAFRGAVVGVYGLMGATGIMIASVAGGQIFDLVSRNAPFTMMGIVNALLLIAAVIVRVRAGRPDMETTKPAGQI